MGGEHHPRTYLEAVLRFVQQQSFPVALSIFATKEVIGFFQDYSKKHTAAFDRCCIDFHESKQVIHLSDPPLSAVRDKKNASMCIGMRALLEKKIDALVSTGNTGALLCSAKRILPKLPNTFRPALLALMPTKHHSLALIDIGANVHCSAKHLVQFAYLGYAFQKTLKVKYPKIGLLNIGEEQYKGRRELQQAYKILDQLNTPEQPPIFLGNIEGREVFDGHIDVLVTDGFTGNILLKAAEGTVSLVLHHLSKNGDLLPNMSKLNYAEFPGAVLTGVDGIVIKCHSYSNPRALINGIKGALNLIQNQFICTMKKHLLSPLFSSIIPINTALGAK